jgi:pimeloyl-ACP methyl ester carboxylesterase
VESGDPGKPLMIFLHGFPDFWFVGCPYYILKILTSNFRYSWRHQIAEFSKDYWTVALDMRGFGDSDKPGKISDYHVDKVVEDLKELVLFLGREKFILIGQSWGAIGEFFPVK